MRQAVLRLAIVSLFLSMPGLLGPPHVGAVMPAAVVALPNGTTTGFAPKIVAITKGGTLDVVGADTTVHNLACVKRNRKTKRPLCRSDYAVAGEVKRVKGVEKLPAGTYALFCDVHPQMTAELMVVWP